MINTGLPLQQKQHVINWFSQDMGISFGMQTNAITLITIHLVSKSRGSGGLGGLGGLRGVGGDVALEMVIFRLHVFKPNSQSHYKACLC